MEAVREICLKFVRRRGWLLGLVLVTVVVLSYYPALRGGFIWDDDDYVTQNSTLRDLHGLYRIWFEVGAVTQYYPLVYTTFWLENHLWGLDPFYFHLGNVLLHALAAILLWRALRWLRVPGCWLAAAIFALHPVCVESVAWITERKIVLSAVFYFSSALAYFRFLAARSPAFALNPNPTRNRTLNPWFWYSLSLVLFVCALWSKTVTCSLPAALLLVMWWKFKPSSQPSQPSSSSSSLLRSAVLPLLPFFALGAGLGFLTAWLEKHLVGAQGAIFALSFLQRCLIAGRALWFYAAKLVWPWPLTLIYPRWNVSTAVWWQWLFPLAALGTVAVLWFARHRIGKGALVAVLFFAGTLFPALGFINVYMTRFSFVADHFQYLASVGLITLAAAGMTAGMARLSKTGAWVGRGIGFIVLVVFGFLTWQQCGTYRNSETLWRRNLKLNPGSVIASYQLGKVLMEQGHVNEAIDYYKQACKLALQGHIADTDVADTHFNLANALVKTGQLEEAIIEYRAALGIRPGDPEAHSNLGYALIQQGRVDDGVAEFEKALELRPGSTLALKNLGYAAWLLTTSRNRTSQDLAKAIGLAERLDQLSGGRDPQIARTLATAYAKAGRTQEAIMAAQRGLQLALGQTNLSLATVLRRELENYRQGTGGQEGQPPQPGK